MAQLGPNRYGKENVRILRVVRQTDTHEAYDLTGSMLLEGPFDASYVSADNTQIVPTETQKNTLYVMSKKYPVDPIEFWVLKVAKDMLSRHSHVTAVTVGVEKNPWKRIVVDGKAHDHAFERGSGGVRFAHLRLTRAGKGTLVAGFRDLGVMKTTQSGFEGFIKDGYTTLQDSRDRVMCTNVFCEWTYKDVTACKSPNDVFTGVKQITLDTFAGPAKGGAYSASVQATLYAIGSKVLQRFPSLEQIRFVLPNIHFYPVNFDDFDTPLKNNGEVFFTFDGARGLIEATVQRPNKAKL